MRDRITRIASGIVVLCLAAVCFLVLAATPSQILSSASAFQAESDRNLRIESTFLLAQLAGMSTPSLILSNASAFQGVSDRGLLESQTFLLANLTAGILVKSNTLASIPTLSPGDTYYWSSNGVAYVITDSPSGTLVTNKLGP